MTTFFHLVTGVCQSLNELGMVSVTKKSGPAKTGPAGSLATALQGVLALWKKVIIRPVMENMMKIQVVLKMIDLVNPMRWTTTG